MWPRGAAGKLRNRTGHQPRATVRGERCGGVPGSCATAVHLPRVSLHTIWSWEPTVAENPTPGTSEWATGSREFSEVGRTAVEDANRGQLLKTQRSIIQCLVYVTHLYDISARGCSPCSAQVLSSAGPPRRGQQPVLRPLVHWPCAWQWQRCTVRTRCRMMTPPESHGTECRATHGQRQSPDPSR